MEPLISIIIPAYNRANTIVTALESIRKQTYRNWEAVVVDDGSTDNTGEIVNQVANNDVRIHLIRHENNRGGQAARNTGIKAAKGEWIAFLDSDDEYLPDSLQVRLAATEKDKVSVVHSGCYVVQDDGIKKIYSLPGNTGGGQIYKKLLKNEGPVFPGLFVSKEAFRKINYLDERITAFQEWDTVIRLARYYAFGFVPQPTFIYYARTSPDRVSSGWIKGAFGYKMIVHKHFIPILLYGGPSALAKHYKNVAFWYKNGGDDRAAFWYSLISKTYTFLEVPRKIMSKIKKVLLSEKGK